MQKSLIIPAFFVLVLCALFAGCASPTGTGIEPAGTVVTTATPATTITPVAVIPTPLPVETLPEEQAVDLVLSKQRPDSSIHLIYNGGKGEVFVKNIMMKVTLSTGQVVQQYMNDRTRQPRRGDELVIAGTRGTDLVQVYVTSSGMTYKVMEEPLVLGYL